jgi:hypothetical protein
MTPRDDVSEMEDIPIFKKKIFDRSASFLEKNTSLPDIKVYSVISLNIQQS